MKLYRGGAASACFKDLDVGSTVTLRRRLGTLTTSTPRTLKWGGVLRRADTVVLVAGGTGITPMVQLCNWYARCTARVPPPAVHLVFANHAPGNIIAKDQLLELAAACEWLRLALVVTVPPTADDPVVAEVERHPRAQLVTGRLNADVLRSVLPKPTAETVVAWCGPTGFAADMDTAFRRLYFVASNYFGFDG